MANSVSVIQKYKSGYREVEKWVLKQVIREFRVQRLRLHALTAWDPGSVPSQGTKSY